MMGYLGGVCLRVHEPIGKSRNTTVVLCPTIGYSESCSRHGLITVARALAAAGYRAIRLDYRGTGDSSGLLDSTAISDWTDDVVSVVQAASAPGRVVLVGVRLGAALAMQAVADANLRNPSGRQDSWRGRR